MNTTSFSNNSDDDYQTAAEWLEQLSEQPLDELSKRRLLLWLDSGNERRALFERMLSAWADPALTQAAQSLLASQSARTATNANAGFRRGAAWALCLTLCVALLVSNRFLGEAPAAKTLPFATATGIRHDLQLSDGSLLEISPASRLAITLDAQQRNIELQEGAAYFRVAKDKSRPFAVTIGTASVVAVGTEFNIDKRLQAVEVTVYEGAIEVRANPAAQPLLLRAGERALISAKGVETLAVNLAELVDWRSGWLELQNGTLELVVDQLNRYSPTPIQLADPALAKIAVAGRFRLKEVDATLQLMTELHQLEQRQTTRQGKAVIQLFARQ